MAIILASIQICSPLLFGLEHSACQLGTVAVFKPFPNPSDVCLRSIARQEGRVHTSDNTANDELVSGQVLYTTIRYPKLKEGDMTHTPGMEVICIIAPIVTKKAPTACHATTQSRDPRINIPMYMFLLLPTLLP